MRRPYRYRRQLSQAGATSGEFAIEPARPAGGGLVTRQNANALLGAGLLLGIGAIGYYVWKGGALGDLFGRLFGGGSADVTPEPQPVRPWDRLPVVLAPPPAGTSVPVGPINPASWGAPSAYTPVRDRGY